jgi:hypothetical protein
MSSRVTLQGQGQNATIVELAAGSNTDVIVGAGFASLTGSGSVTGGIYSWRITDLTIDGNKANNSTGYGVRVFGYMYDLNRVTIRNCAQDGLYSEFGRLGTPPPDGGMESRYINVRIHDCGRNGWHHRGPNDSHFDSVFIHNNGAIGLWIESMDPIPISSGSDGVNLSSFTGSGTLEVSSTVGYPTSGTLTVPTSAGNRTVTYSGMTTQSFTGCRSSGAGVVTAGTNISSPGAYFGTGLAGSALHVWGRHTVGVQCDNGLIQAAVSLSEGATTGQVWFRACDCAWVGGKIFTGSATNVDSFGLRLGDAAGYSAGNCLIDTFFGDQDFAGNGSSTASVDFASTFGNRVSGYISAQSGSAHITGTPSENDVVDLAAYGQDSLANAANSRRQSIGATRIALPNATEAWRLLTDDGHVINVNTTEIGWSSSVALNFASTPMPSQRPPCCSTVPPATWALHRTAPRRQELPPVRRMGQVRRNPRSYPAPVTLPDKYFSDPDRHRARGRKSK